MGKADSGIKIVYPTDLSSDHLLFTNLTWNTVFKYTKWISPPPQRLKNKSIKQSIVPLKADRLWVYVQNVLSLPCVLKPSSFTESDVIRWVLTLKTKQTVCSKSFYCKFISAKTFKMFFWQ